MSRKYKEKLDEEVVIEETIIEEGVVITEAPKRIVNLDKIVKEDMRLTLSEISDRAIEETFELLGMKLEHIESAINLYGSSSQMKALMYIAELDVVAEKEDKVKLIHKIVPFIKK